MKVKDLEKYNELKEVNKEDMFIIKLIEAWADLMEQAIESDNKEVKDIAYDLSFPAVDKVGGATGFQISYAAQMLDMHWLYGGNVYASVFKRN